MPGSASGPSTTPDKLLARPPCWNVSSPPLWCSVWPRKTGRFVRAADLFRQGRHFRSRPEWHCPLQRLPRCALHSATAVVTPDFDELCTFIRLRLRRRALLIFLTALDDPLLAESFVRNMDLICRQHLILVNMIQPPGVLPCSSTSRTLPRRMIFISSWADICSGKICANWKKY